MNEKKTNTGLIVVLVILIMLILFGGSLFILSKMGYISFEKNNDVIDKDNENSKEDDDYNVDIKILSIDEVKISKESPSHNLVINGKMELIYKEENFVALGLGGYCLGKNGEKYPVGAPLAGSMKPYSNTEFRMGNSINNSEGDVIYPNGTKKAFNEIDWDNVKIQYCKIESMSARTKEGQGISKEINFEKYFDNKEEIIDYNNLKGSWYVDENDRGYTRLDVESVNGNELKLTLFVYRLTTFDTITAIMNGNTGTFSDEINTEGIITIEDNKITLVATKSSLMPIGYEFVFAYKG